MVGSAVVLEVKVDCPQRKAVALLATVLLYVAERPPSMTTHKTKGGVSEWQLVT